MRRAASLACFVLAGCGVAVDTQGLPTIEGFQSWHRVDVTGPIPAHGDTYRHIYVNDVGRSYAGSGYYPVGTVIVKDVRFLDGGGPGERDYLAAMRKLGDDSVDLDVPTQDGWLFTIFSEPEDTERQRDGCFDACHVQGPVDHAWFDYGDIEGAVD